MCCVLRVRSVSIAGASSDASDAWAAWRVVCGVSSKCWGCQRRIKVVRMSELTRVLDNTVLRRGKSVIPWSRIAIEESSSEREERREETDAASDAVDDDDDD